MPAITKPISSIKSIEQKPSRTNEVIGIIFIGFSLVMLLSLLSFYPYDHSWSVSGTTGKTHNWIGIVGASIADVLFQSIGLVAYLFPLIIAYLGWKKIFNHFINVSIYRIIGVVIFFISISGFLSLFPEIPFYRDRVRLGGFVGYITESFLETNLNKTGTGVVLILTILLALMAMTSLSIRKFLKERVSVDILKQYWITLKNRILRNTNTTQNGDIQNQTFHTQNSTDYTQKKNAKFSSKLNIKQPSIAQISENKLVNEQAVSEALYSSNRGSIPNQLNVPVNLDQSSNEPKIENINSSSLPYTTPIQHSLDQSIPDNSIDTPGSRTRRFAREAIARAQQRAATQRLTSNSPTTELDSSHKIVEEVKSEEADPEIEKMVESASIVRRKPEENIYSSSSQKQSLPINKNLSYQLPTAEMLQLPPERQEQKDSELWERALVLAEKCKEFNVTGQIQHINPGPVVTTFEFKPDPGVKYSRVANLVDDLCLALKAESIRIDRLAGKSTVGIEVPNIHREIIYLREIVESEKYVESLSPMTIALGKTIEGETFSSDLIKMPHLLIAGSTGSGKSVMVNTLICSILLKASPADVKMIMVDPKRLELGLYEGIPHLLTPIVTDPKRASNALKWAVTEMENRYKQLAGFGVRNISQFNNEICTGSNFAQFGLEEPPKKLPYIVIVIDELADLMMVASSDVETSITRLAQMARAVGIHLVVATQRPSVDVITGLIKANFPARISFRVSSKVDSRTILDTNGAEGLLGQGDMLFLLPGTSRLVRIHGSYVGEAEINRIVTHVKAQGKPQYDESILLSEVEAEVVESGGGERDELYDEAIKIIGQMGRASTSVLQRRLRIGYGRAAAMLDMMEREGYVGPSEGSKPRIVKQAAYDYIEMLDGHALNPSE